VVISSTGFKLKEVFPGELEGSTRGVLLTLSRLYTLLVWTTLIVE
jgi:hypothetical protein